MKVHRFYGSSLEDVESQARAQLGFDAPALGLFKRPWWKVWRPRYEYLAATDGLGNTRVAAAPPMGAAIRSSRAPSSDLPPTPSTMARQYPSAGSPRPAALRLDLSARMATHLEEGSAERLNGRMRPRTTSALLDAKDPPRGDSETGEQVPPGLPMAMDTRRNVPAASGPSPSGGLIRAKASALVRCDGRRVRAILTGPTGAGKSTTLAKLAAQSALHQSQRVALATADTLRPGAGSQLEAIATILQVPFLVAQSPDHLSRWLADVRADHIFVDLPGVPPRSAWQHAELKAWIAAAMPTHTYVVLPAGLASDHWLRLATVFGSPCAHPAIILTKVDEVESWDNLQPAVAQLGWPIAYLGTGLRIPEDLAPGPEWGGGV